MDLGVTMAVLGREWGQTNSALLDTALGSHGPPASTSEGLPCSLHTQTSPQAPSAGLGAGRVHAPGLVKSPKPSLGPALGSAQTSKHTAVRAGSRASQQGRVHLGVTHTHTGPQSIHARYTDAQAHGLWGAHTQAQSLDAHLSHTHTGPRFAWSPPAQVPLRATDLRQVAEAVGRRPQCRQSWPRVTTLAAHLAKPQVLSALMAAETRASKSSRRAYVAAGPGETGVSHPNRQGRGSRTPQPSSRGPHLPVAQPAGPLPSGPPREQTLMERVPLRA